MTHRPFCSGRLASALIAVSAGVLAVCLFSVPASGARQTYYVPVSKSWTVNGHGYGHGHGMSQYGAQGAALKGLNYTQIANFYYPRTDWAQVKGNVRVLISADTTSDLQVRARNGLTVRDLNDNAKWPLPATNGIDSWRLTPNPSGSTSVQYHNASGWHRWQTPDGRRAFKSDGQFEARGPITLLVPSGSDVVGKAYRGFLRSVRPYAGATTRDTVNVLTMDQYVQGVVPYEMPASWEQQALRAQAVAARTYAAYERALNPQRYWQICDTTSCQVYGGVAAEQQSSNNAVQATAGKILTYNGKAAFTQFSSSSGGWTSDGGQPYLPQKRDPYDGFEGNAMHSWTAQVSASTLESAHPEVGDLIDITVTRREGRGQWHGRAQQIVLHGSDGNAFMTGDDFRWTYGLRSNWFSIAPTPIIERWRDLGGEKSELGAPASGEYAYERGSAQNFKHGRIFWFSRTGAREMQGPILTTYKAFGGPTSKVGWPTSGMLKAPDNGHKVSLQRGRVYGHPRAGAHIVYGAIMRRWDEEGSASGWMGYPTRNVFAISGGMRGIFEHGVISWDRSTDTFTVKER